MTTLSPSVDHRFFAATASALAKAGFDLEAESARRGFRNPLAWRGERIPLALVAPVYRHAEEALGDPAFIYRLIEHGTLQGQEMLGSLLMHCDTPLTMLRLACRFSSLASDAVRYEFTTTGDEITLRVSPNPLVEITPHQEEMAAWLAARWSRFLGRLAGIRSRSEIRFAHAARFPVEDYQPFYPDIPLRFGAGVTTLRIRGEGLTRPVPGHDQRQLDYLRSQAERYEVRTAPGASLGEQVGHLFLQRMAFGEPGVDEIAQLLGLGRRTLQRKLAEEGASWRSVTDAVRLQVASHELRVPGRRLHEIALLVGFEDFRAFLRAFRRWTGTTPARYRERLPA